MPTPYLVITQTGRRFVIQSTNATQARVAAGESVRIVRRIGGQA